MTKTESHLALDDDMKAIRAAAKVFGWRIVEHQDLVFVIDMTSQVDKETYRLRFVCTGYPGIAPSIKPVDPESLRSDVVSAWPACDGFRPVSDLCMPLSAEGYALHPEWGRDPSFAWISSGNPALRVLEELQALLNNSSKYRGRA